MHLLPPSCHVEGSYATLKQESPDGKISRTVVAETDFGTEIKDKFEKKPTDKTLYYTETYESRDNRGFPISQKEILHRIGDVHRIKIKNDNYEMVTSAKIDNEGNRISPWQIDRYESFKTNLYPWNDSIRGLPDKISDLPKQVQKAYVAFFEKCEKLLNEYRKEQGMK